MQELSRRTGVPYAAIQRGTYELLPLLTGEEKKAFLANLE
jgi:hypothetical protein